MLTKLVSWRFAGRYTGRVVVPKLQSRFVPRNNVFVDGVGGRCLCFALLRASALEGKGETKKQTFVIYVVAVVEIVVGLALTSSVAVWKKILFFCFCFLFFIFWGRVVVVVYD